MICGTLSFFLKRMEEKLGFRNHKVTADSECKGEEEDIDLQERRDKRYIKPQTDEQ